MGRGNNGPRTQWDWATLGLGHDGTGPRAQWEWVTMGLGHKGPGPRDWASMGLGHKGPGPRHWATVRLGHNGVVPPWDWATMGQGTGPQWDSKTKQTHCTFVACDSEWATVAFHDAFWVAVKVVYSQWCLVVTWLVPSETAVDSHTFCVHHITMHQSTVTLHTKPCT